LQEEPRSGVSPKSETKEEPKPATPSGQKTPAQRKVYTAEELRQTFIPVIEKLLKQDESMPFRQPVDAIQLSIPVSVCSEYIIYVGEYNI